VVLLDGETTLEHRSHDREHHDRHPGGDDRLDEEGGADGGRHGPAQGARCQHQEREVDRRGLDAHQRKRHPQPDHPSLPLQHGAT
jgi:hypothetical protein